MTCATPLHGVPAPSRGTTPSHVEVSWGYPNSWMVYNEKSYFINYLNGWFGGTPGNLHVIHAFMRTIPQLWGPTQWPSPAQVSASRNFLFQEYLQSKGTLTSSRPQTCLGCRWCMVMRWSAWDVELYNYYDCLWSMHMRVWALKGWVGKGVRNL